MDSQMLRIQALVYKTTKSNLYGDSIPASLLEGATDERYIKKENRAGYGDTM